MYKMFHGSTIYKVRSGILHVDRSCEDMYNKIGLPYPPRCLIEKCAQDANIAKSIQQSLETLSLLSSLPPVTSVLSTKYGQVKPKHSTLMG